MSTQPNTHPDPDFEGGTCDVSKLDHCEANAIKRELIGRRAIDFIPPHINVLAAKALDAQLAQPKRAMPQHRHDVLWNAARYFLDFTQNIQSLRNQLEGQGLHSVLPDVYAAEDSVREAYLTCSTLAAAYWPAGSKGRTQ